MAEQKEESKLISLTDETFPVTIKEHPHVLVDFWAEWCMPCAMLVPMMEELAGKYDGKVLFTGCNVDENPKTTADFQVRALPTILLFKDGAIAERITGVVTKDSLSQKVEDCLL